MTIHEKIKKMKYRMARMRDEATNSGKKACFELLHDAIENTGSRINDLDDSSLIGYIELASLTVCNKVESVHDLRNRLTKLGFNTSLVN